MNLAFPKPKKRRKPGKTAGERFHMNRIAEMGCVICQSPAEIHHLLHCKWGRSKRDHRAIVPLCYAHHRDMSKEAVSVHKTGNELKFFEEMFLPDIYIWALEQWNESVRLYNG